MVRATYSLLWENYPKLLRMIVLSPLSDNKYWAVAWLLPVRLSGVILSSSSATRVPGRSLLRAWWDLDAPFSIYSLIVLSLDGFSRSWEACWARRLMLIYKMYIAAGYG